VRAFALQRLLAASCLLVAAGCLCAQVAPSSLAAQDAEFQKLYQQTSSSVVRVSVTQDVRSILRGDNLLEKFDAWLKNGGDRPERGGRTRVPGDTRGGATTAQSRPDMGPATNSGFGGRGGPGTGSFGGAMGGGMGGAFGGRGGGGNDAFSVRTFYIDQANQLQKDNPDLAARYRGQALRVQMNPGGFPGDLLAAVIDDQGHALLLGGVFRESQNPANPMTVTASDGTTARATFIGTCLFTGITVIQLDKPKIATVASLAKRKLAPGQMLLPITIGQPFTPLVHVQARRGEPFNEERLPPDDQANPRFERNGAILFNTEGNLAAVVTGGGGWPGEHYTFSASRMQRDVAYMLQGKGQDIEPRSLGVDFVPLTAPTAPAANAPKANQDAYNIVKKAWDETNKLLAGRRGVQVKAVTKDSLAASAGLKSGDIILSIDGRPTSELVNSSGTPLPNLIQFQVDIVTRAGEIPIVVLRDGKEQTLKMPLQPAPK
jgi:S1-C subfamily serine protease